LYLCLVAKSWQDNAISASFHVPFLVLDKATDHFSPQEKIGGGGSCDVFKGIVYGAAVAIKALNPSEGEEHQQLGAIDESSPGSALSSEGKQFFAEMEMLQKAHHPNICRLLVCNYQFG
jgi:serine/threonine protein kinase